MKEVYNYLLKAFIGIPIQILILFVGHAHTELEAPVIEGYLRNTFSENREAQTFPGCWSLFCGMIRVAINK